MRSKFLLLVFGSILFLSECFCWLPLESVGNGEGDSQIRTVEGVVIVGGSSGGCAPPPESFTEADLIGTWVAGWSEMNDTLIIQDNGLYKQIIYDKAANYSYESEWQRWWVEFGESGTPYLYLEGMHICVATFGIDCKQIGGGDQGFYDFCEERMIHMPDKGVLAVIGVPHGHNPLPRGFRLSGFVIDPDVGGWSYILKEP
jgi:hypothetical protein